MFRSASLPASFPFSCFRKQLCMGFEKLALVSWSGVIFSESAW